MHFFTFVWNFLQNFLVFSFRQLLKLSLIRIKEKGSCLRKVRFSGFIAGIQENKYAQSDDY